MLKRLPHNQPRAGTVLEVDNLRFVYPPPRAVVGLGGVSFTVSAGEYVAIIGENGSGKTTLARCLSTYLQPTSGKIRVLGRDLFRTPIRERSHYAGYVFQNPDQQLFRSTVRDDVLFSLHSFNYPVEMIAEAAETILDDLELAEQAQQHPFQLSKGDRQRLAIAVVAVMQPAILIIDEPTTGLDAARSHEVMRLCRRLRDQLGMTILTITHNMELVAEYCNRAIVMGGGQMLLDGPPAAVFGHPEILARTKVDPPPIAALCSRLGLAPPPLRVAEAADRLLEMRP